MYTTLGHSIYTFSMYYTPYTVHTNKGLHTVYSTHYITTIYALYTSSPKDVLEDPLTSCFCLVCFFCVDRF